MPAEPQHRLDEIWVSRLQKTPAWQEDHWERTFFGFTDGHARGVNTNWLPALPTADGKRMLREAKAGAPATIIEIASGRVLFIFAFPWRIRRGTRAQRKT